MNSQTAKRKYTDEEKRQLVANLDIEVAHRCRQFEAWLQDRLENFTIYQEGQVLRIPKQVRTMTMRDFGEKYNGNTQLALRGFQKDRLAAAGAGPDFGEIEKSMRKRKQEAEKESSKDTDSRPLKNAKTAPASPYKVRKPSSSIQQSRSFTTLSKPSIAGPSRLPSRVPGTPSPEKRPPFNNTTSTYNPRPASRPASPSKPAATQSRVPSTSSFNPSIPKSATFPNFQQLDDPTTKLRLPRKDENMLSVNGSPIANPFQFGMGWFKGVEMGEDDDAEDSTETGTGASRTLKRSKSSIVIRRDPSVAFSNLHSRTASQASLFAPSNTDSSISDHDSQPSIQPGSGFRFPPNRPLPTVNGLEATPRPTHTRSFSAMVAIPTKDGHLLEFDPLQTSPGALDALEGITDSAKKQARTQMGKLVQAAVEMWKL
ncbi:hypothetical protein FA15DRAFT_692097 [Coprinopsis marcescibilis]|uniref:Borealin N-terminal domain-containing protein n=1 Tax=Coprinopsis marcescibilis TaxID=230819 RepID=A0A5C3L7E3_COPMA|nr:hypothetical protein FA15DRAFT_692097 [Coprinopsis marcescibilis]